MTTHYTLQITKTGTTIKLTYRGGRLLRWERKTGKITDKQLWHFGTVLPPSEGDIDRFRESNAGKVTYTEIVTERSLYHRFTDAWFAFYERTHEMPPKFNGIEGKALKQIMGYFRKAAGDDTRALQAWQGLLTNWQSLDEFHQQNCELKYINGSLQKIIQNLKRVTDGKSGISGSYLSRIYEDLQSG